MKQKCRAKRKPKLKQAEDGTSGLEDEMVIKGKIEELLVRQLKFCEGMCKNFPTASKD
jgi:hypothetical protein